MIDKIMGLVPRGVKAPTLAAIGAAALAAVLVTLMSAATTPATQIPMPPMRPYLVEEAYVRPVMVRTIPITKSDPDVVARHEPPELYGEDPLEKWRPMPTAAPNRNKRTRAAREIVDYLPERRPRDICAKHRMRKEYTNNGRSWRCRR